MGCKMGWIPSPYRTLNRSRCKSSLTLLVHCSQFFYHNLYGLTTRTSDLLAGYVLKYEYNQFNMEDKKTKNIYNIHIYIYIYIYNIYDIYVLYIYYIYTYFKQLKKIGKLII